MIKVLIFGGTTEGRKLCGFCRSNNISALYCTATEDGARLAESLPGVNVSAGRMNADEMSGLLAKCSPELVIDATHPYAQEASKNISRACMRMNARLVRIKREFDEKRDCRYFTDKYALIPWLEQEQGNVFVTTGLSSADVFVNLTNFQKRIWMRILPNKDSLQKCLALGYPSMHLICMQGPFSEELNYAMFQKAEARILITKDSGAVGGFPEKIRAARRLNMLTAVVSRPDDETGISLGNAYELLTELRE